jgi:hypothetical protein
MSFTDPLHTYDHSTAVRPTLVAYPHEADTVAIGDAIADLAARIHAATYELLVLIREFDARAGWNNGFLSCAHWLNWRTGIDLGAAREKVRVAHALSALPLLSAAMERGQLSYSKVRAVTRVATPDNEARLLDAARCATAAQVERLVRAWRRVDRVIAAQETERRYLRRQLHTWVDEDGMVVIRGRLTPEVGAVVQRAIEAAADRLFRESSETPAATTLAEEVMPAQRRADALGLLAESALASDLDRGSSGDRYQVVLHLEPAALRSEAASDADDGQAALEDGLQLSAETSRRLACDAGVVVIEHHADGTVLDVGRKTRTIPPAIRRALAARDIRCRFPGCTARHCDAHHVRHWADGGSTRLDNLVLLCRRHHRFVHEQGWTLRMHADGTVEFWGPDGTWLEPAPSAPSPIESSQPLAPIDAHLSAAGITIGPYTATPVSYGERLDLGWTIDVLRDREFRGLERPRTQ